MWFLKASLPGSIPFLLAGFSIGLVLLSQTRTQSWGRRWLQGLFALYLLLSLPAVSQLVAGPLSWGFKPIERAGDVAGATAVVVLDGGTDRSVAAGRVVERVNEPSALRAIEALRVAAFLEKPLIVITGGLETSAEGWSLEGELLRQEMVRAGIPAERVVLDSASNTTRDHARTVTNLLHQRGVARFVLVTSATHIRRATAAFRVEGADLVPSPAPTQSDEVLRGWRALWPTPSALAVSEDTMHDYLGLFYYWSRAWI